MDWQLLSMSTYDYAAVIIGMNSFQSVPLVSPTIYRGLAIRLGMYFRQPLTLLWQVTDWHFKVHRADLSLNPRSLFAAGRSIHKVHR